MYTFIKKIKTVEEKDGFNHNIFTPQATLLVIVYFNCTCFHPGVQDSVDAKYKCDRACTYD